MEPKIDIRHKHIIGLINSASSDKKILNVGAGSCKIDYHLIKLGFNVISTDYQRVEYFDNIMKDYESELDFRLLDIFNSDTYPVESSEIVLCCEVLEHLVDYKTAFTNLISLTEKRLIVTVPYKNSYDMQGPPPIVHCNYWDDNGSGNYKNINEFADFASPHKINISKIITKPEDKQKNQFVYIIIIDKYE